MKFVFQLLISGLIVNISLAQQKPELPADYFEQFSHTLSPGFNYNDPVLLKKEVYVIAKHIEKKLGEASAKYDLNKPGVLFNYLTISVPVNILIGNHKAAIDAMLKCNELRPLQKYSLNGYWVAMAYSKVCLKQPDNNSTTFKTAFTSAIISELNQVDNEFKNDIISQLKGRHNGRWYHWSWKLLKDLLDQVINKHAGRLDFTNALAVISNYNTLMMSKYHQALIQTVLNTISPSHIVEEKIKIPMRDGIKLNAFVYRDISSPVKKPAIITLSPYPNGFEATKGNFFANNGYNLIWIDNRGRRESEGVFIPYENDARDLYDIIDWVSKQPWCDGQVATTGGSYLGFAQWQAIRKNFKHPSLKAINPIVSVGFGIDFPRKNEQFYPYIVRWATFVNGNDLNLALFSDTKFWDSKYYELYKKRIPFSKLDSVTGFPNPVFQKWVSHPDFDYFWQDILPTPNDYEAIDIPILSITGYFDSDQPGAMYYYNNHQQYGNALAKSKHYLLIGPYDHGGAQWLVPPSIKGEPVEKEAQIPFNRYILSWFDWVLKKKRKPEFIKGPITYFESGNNRWRGTSSFEKITTDSLELFLSPALIQNKKRGNLFSLSMKKPETNSGLKYIHDISMTLDSAYLFSNQKAFSDSLYMNSPYNLVFESEPLRKDILITNKIIGRIYLSLNLPDADFEISVHEISSDGSSRELANSGKRVRYRNSGEKPELAKPGEICLLNFDNAFTYIKNIRKGSRLRLVFQSMNHFKWEKNYGFGGVVSKETTSAPRIIDATILMNEKFPSKIVIPYAQSQ